MDSLLSKQSLAKLRHDFSHNGKIETLGKVDKVGKVGDTHGSIWLIYEISKVGQS